jgi:hypothetical protein
MPIDESGQFARFLPVVTALPSSPVDGQQILYQVDTANGIYWHLRYRAASPNAHKWEPVGEQQPMYASIETNDNLTVAGGNAWAASATPGPDITPALAGVYRVRFGAFLNPAQVGAQAQVGVSVGTGNDPATDPIAVNGSGYAVSVSREWKAGAVAAATRFRLMYRDAGTGTSSLSKRWISVLPVRVN